MNASDFQEKTENVDWKIFYSTGFHAYHPTEQKILGFADLKKKVSGRELRAVSDEAIEEALKIHSIIFFQGFPETDAFDGEHGEIQIIVFNGDQDFEFTRTSNGKWMFVREYMDEQQEFVTNLGFDEIKNIASDLSKDWTICSTSRFSENEIGSKGKAGSILSPFYLQVMAVEYPSLKSLVLSRETKDEEPFVATLKSTMPKLQMTRPSSGNLMQVFSLKKRSWPRLQVLPAMIVTGTSQD